MTTARPETFQQRRHHSGQTSSPKAEEQQPRDKTDTVLACGCAQSGKPPRPRTLARRPFRSVRPVDLWTLKRQTQQLAHIPKCAQLPPLPNDYNSRQRGHFRGRERAPGVLQIMALWKVTETCGSSQGDHISCHNDNYSISAISINHIIIRCAISTGAVITISAQAARSRAPAIRNAMEMEMMPVVYNDTLELHKC